MGQAIIRRMQQAEAPASGALRARLAQIENGYLTMRCILLFFPLQTEWFPPGS